MCQARDFGQFSLEFINKDKDTSHAQTNGNRNSQAKDLRVGGAVGHSR